MKTLKTKYLVLVLLLLATHPVCQARWHKGFINLDFQQDKDGAPISWCQNPCYEGHPPQYHFGVDPNGHNGAKAIWITNDSVNGTFGAASLNIMAGYEARKLSFRAMSRRRMLKTAPLDFGCALTLFKASTICLIDS